MNDYNKGRENSRDLKDNICLYNKADGSREDKMSAQETTLSPTLQDELNGYIYDDKIFKEIVKAYITGEKKCNLVYGKDIPYEYATYIRNRFTQLKFSCREVNVEKKQNFVEKLFNCKTKVCYTYLEVSWEDENKSAIKTINRYVGKFALSTEELKETYEMLVDRLKRNAVNHGDRSTYIYVPAGKDERLVYVQIINRFAKDNLHVTIDNYHERISW